MAQPTYHKLSQLVELILEPNRSKIRSILADHRQRFKDSPGSSSNHQAWPGGYWDHITEVMNIGRLLFDIFESTGRFELLPEEERFGLSDVLLVLFLHDIEKPWRYNFGANGKPAAKTDMKDKKSRSDFRSQIISQYHIALTDQQQDALKHVEGIPDSEYFPSKRTMKPLALICHMSDYASARLFYDFPLPEKDPWRGAKRVLS